MIRGHPDNVKKMWEFVCKNDKACILKKFVFVVPEEGALVKRKHSATEFRTAEQYLRFIRFDHRLVFSCGIDNSIVSFFVPLKRLDFSEICPPGVHDDTNIIDNLLAKQADYNLWVQDMKQKFPNIRVLKKCNSRYDLKQLAIFPMQVVYSGNSSFQSVFIPAFSSREVGRGSCRNYRLGELFFGPGYRFGDGFDVVVRGYWFA